MAEQIQTTEYQFVGKNDTDEIRKVADIEKEISRSQRWWLPVGLVVIRRVRLFHALVFGPICRLNRRRFFLPFQIDVINVPCRVAEQQHLD